MGLFDDQISQLKSTATNFLENQLGIKGATSSASSPNVPWVQTGKFFVPIKIDEKRWNQLYPYRFIVVDVSGSKPTIVGGGSPSISIKSSGTLISFEPLGQKWDFRLPITPQQLNITDQFAINTTATLRGIAEEHNGVKFKTIVASGTMGVWPYRSSVTSPPASPSVAQSLFGGAIESATNLVSQASRVLNAASSNHPANKPKTLTPEETPEGKTSTGYYNAIALQQFFEQYAEAKKDPKNAGWRLVFDVIKQNQSFVVTPVQYSWIQNQNRPTEINYSFQLKAWRRIGLDASTLTVSDVQKLTPGILQRIANTISEARKLMSASVNLIGAVRSDIERPLDILRQIALFIKDLSGVAITAADLPFQIQRDYESPIANSMASVFSALISSSSPVANDQVTRDAMKAIIKSSQGREGLSISAVASGQLGRKSTQSQSIDPAGNVFRQPERNHTLIDQIPLFSLKLNNAQQAQVDKILEDVRQLTVDDLKTFRATIQDLSLQLSNNFGAGDSYYSQIYNRPAPISRVTPMTLDEYDILRTLYDVMQVLDILTATTDIDDRNKQTNMEYVAGLADEANIAFNIPGSKILAPVPFGLSVEQISARYLGDPQRWIEIVTLNNLRDPYIDENGFNRTLLSNATGRQITISSIEDMYVGQRIVLRSSTQNPSARRILGIDRLSDTSFLLTLDGESNLGVFTVADGAYIQAYLPGTVNSQQKIFIPSDLPVSNEASILTPASVASDPLVGLSKVDWLLTDKGDIAVNSFGDFRLSAGMTNLIQAIKIKISTTKGSVLTHSSFGLGLNPGTMSSDVNVQDIYNSIAKLVEEDPRFQSLDSLQVQLNGPTLSISMGIILAGVQGVFPLTFELAS